MNHLLEPISASERRLLDAIVTAPDDDAPRLVYADWLQAHGDEVHGPLIMLQCELARLRAEAGEDPRAAPAQLHEDELALLTRPELAWYPRHGTREWLPALRTVRGFSTASALWSRPAAFLDHFLARERLEPFARHLVLFPIEWSTIAELGRRGALDRFETLYFNRAQPDDRLDRALAPGPLPRLRELNLEGVSLEPATIDHLLAPPMPALEAVSIGDSALAPGTLHRLVERAPDLRRLSLGRGGLDDDELHAILALELDELMLGGVNLPEALCRRLEDSIPRCRLRHAAPPDLRTRPGSRYRD